MSRLVTPPVAELIRTPSTSVDEAVRSLCGFYEIDAKVNFLTSTKAIKSAYRGFHNINALLAAFDKKFLGSAANRNVVQLAAPIAFNRSTQVFDLPPKKFPFGRDRLASYRIPFFFVEDGIVKCYFLLPRKGPYLNFDQVCGCATIHKRYLLDQEFYGEKTDLEIVDISAREKGGPRELRVWNTADLQFWSDDRLMKHLTVVSEALDRIENEALVKKNKRTRLLRDPELPLFD